MFLPKALRLITIVVFSFSWEMVAVSPLPHNYVPNSIYYVATDGSDASGDGSTGNPWATIGHAIQEVPDDSTILVRPGTYSGRVRLDRIFSQGVIVQSEVTYQARLRNNGTVVTCFYGQGITLEGFDIAHSDPSASALVIQIQDLLVGSEQVSRITLRNNILHDSYNNDILKVNNNAAHVLVEGNIFYNQQGSDEHIDVNSVTNIVIQDNVFFNDFAGSGRVNNNDTSSYIVIKDSNQGDDGQWGSQHIVVRRNVFFNWQGSTGQGFVRVGEDGQPFYEASDVLIENNLMLGNSANKIRSPFQVMNASYVTIRANTVIGNMPALEFGNRIFTYGSGAPTNDQIHLHNNIWADPTGTMGDTFNRGNNTNNLTFDRNLFWNAGNPFPTSPESIIEVSDDDHRVIGDPLLGSQVGLILPRWDSGIDHFADGSTTIRQVFEKLVLLYGTPAAGSPAIDAADPAYTPAEDILGHPRPAGSAPDIGAVEFIPSLELSAAPGDQATYLHWAVNISLPITSTWQVDYEGPTGDQVPPITGIISSTRTYTLTGLTNYTWYTITLNAMLDGTPILTNTVQVMPTDHIIFLPVVRRDIVP